MLCAALLSAAQMYVSDASLLLVALRTLPLLLVSHYVGATCKRLQLPQITGYLLTGVLGGPHGLHLLSNEATRCARLPGRLTRHAVRAFDQLPPGACGRWTTSAWP